jgi:hypothetical protein
MKLSHLGALAVTAVIGMNLVAVPAQAGLLGDIARKGFTVASKIASHNPCKDRARAERDQMFAISKNNPYGTESAIKANAQARLEKALRACER